ncbi:hypothetical protein ACFQ9X_41730 [Catenulispora yoronensis]
MDHQIAAAIARTACGAGGARGRVLGWEDAAPDGGRPSTGGTEH